MARLSQSRNLKGFGWLTKSRVTYHRDVAKERRALKRDAIEARKERIALKKLEAEERAADAKIAMAQRKIETAGKKADTGGMAESRFEAMKARMESEIAKQEEYKAAARARAGNPCARTRKSTVTDRAKRYRANQRGCKPKGVKKCKLCGAKSDLMVDHVDGFEENNRKANLRWLCRSCNTLLGAEMARTGQGRRTVQYNPKSTGGAQSLGEYINAVLQHTRGAHDEGGKIIHATPKWKRQEYASEIWSARHGRGNPAPQPGRRNSALEFSTEYHLGYNLGQADRQSANLRKTLDELHATFAANFPPESMASWESFETAYAAGYSGQMGAAAPNPVPHSPYVRFVVLWKQDGRGAFDEYGGYLDKRIAEGDAGRLRAAGHTAKVISASERTRTNREPADDPKCPLCHKPIEPQHTAAHDRQGRLVHDYCQRTRGNPEPAGDGSEEYQQALRTAELFHGRPVKEQIEVEEKIRTHDWYVSIGPLIKLKVKIVTGKRATFPFSVKGDALVNLFCSPDGRQMYLRGGDQELDLKALDMEQGTRWYRDRMVIGQITEITYQDRKKFHSFELVQYWHRLGEETKVKPWLLYDTMNKHLEIIGGQYHVETEALVESMSPGLVN